jgi:small GTP-binding protein
MSFLLRLFKPKIKNVNLTICGLDKAGKTTMVNYLIHGEFRETIPTAGMNREKISLPKIELDIFDLGGQSEFRPMWSDYNEKSDALIFVVDSSDYDRLDEAREIFNGIIATQITENIPVLLLLNKVDIPGHMDIMEFIQKFGLNDPSSQIKWAVFETSAKTGEGILDSMQWLVNLFGDE